MSVPIHYFNLWTHIHDPEQNATRQPSFFKSDLKPRHLRIVPSRMVRLLRFPEQNPHGSFVWGGHAHAPYLLRVSNPLPCLFSWPCLFLTLYSSSLGEPIVISHSCLLIWSLYKNLLLFFLEFFFCFGALFYLFLSIKKKITSKRLAAYSALFSSDFSLFNTYPLIQPRLILIYSMKAQSKILFLQIEKHFALFYFWDRILWCSLGWYGTPYVA